MNKDIAQISDDIRDRETEEYLNKTIIDCDMYENCLDEEIEEDLLKNYKED